MLDPVKPILLLPEVLDSSKWKKGGVWYSDPEGIYVPRLLYYVARMFYVNTREAKLEQFKSIKELLNPRWKGKIATMDPTVLGSGLANASQLYLFGEAFVKRFYVDQKPVISRDQRQLTDWVVRGVYPIVFGARESEGEKFRQEGFPVYSVCSLPDAPGSVSAGFGAVGLMNKAPHPNAAHVFVNWLLSKKVSKRTQEPTGLPLRVMMSMNLSLTGRQFPKRESSTPSTRVTGKITPRRKGRNSDCASKSCSAVSGFHSCVGKLGVGLGTGAYRSSFKAGSDVRLRVKSRVEC